ncbi:MAG TPA: carbohydrate ABC transporter permease [Candidatus Alectryocaccomicrobium excrementavium]|uniref:Carbohydrate ABC transporter permease n=1 Tax=Candidatus Alectryocaccomicrobium excrementavium TaxID=2840668 RepID=A0A9D1FXV8_9FIRM|nr:carbohydrate ABC transporter permease [Candidatus Alectryocaccomicrobium excrementavium]
MKYKRTFGDKLFDGINILVMIFLILITLYPLWHVLMTSFASPEAISKYGSMLIWPEGFNLTSYKYVLTNPMIGIGYRNTLLIVLVGTSLSLFMTCLGAYGLACKWVMGHKWMVLLVTIPMFFGGGLIPSYLLVRSLGLYNSFWALILPGVVSSWNMIMMRTYFQGIPESLSESARIDGANDIHILFRILVPCAIPIVAVMILFYAVGYWNAWFNASIYLKDRDKYPLQLVLRGILISGSQRDFDTGYLTGANKTQIFKGLKYATVVVSTLPILLVYPFLQKYFVKGIMVGSIKG